MLISLPQLARAILESISYMYSSSLGYKGQTTKLNVWNFDDLYQNYMYIRHPIRIRN
jgi:hypothetical protein